MIALCVNVLQDVIHCGVLLGFLLGPFMPRNLLKVLNEIIRLRRWKFVLNIFIFFMLRVVFYILLSFVG